MSAHATAWYPEFAGKLTDALSAVFTGAEDYRLARHSVCGKLH